MSFPKTRVTLIRRLAAGGSEHDWHQFLADYWGPLCGFAAHWGGLTSADAEDVAAQVFQILWESEILSRWERQPAAKLRTLLCGIARKLISNRFRMDATRKRILSELANDPRGIAATWQRDEATHDEGDVFYAAWAEDLLRQSLDKLLISCHRDGEGDYFRVLYGRLCEELTMREIADALSIETTTAENYFKTAKARLRRTLESAVRQHVERYADEENVNEAFGAEWHQLSEYLSKHGGLEKVARESHRSLGDKTWFNRKSELFRATKTRITETKEIKRKNTE